MYRERRSRLEGAVVWSRTGTAGGRARVLPDGCMDLLLWNGRLVVAGPDTRAHLVVEEPGDRFAGLRLRPGAGPSVFGVRAHELRDQRVPLGALWPEREVRLLTERVSGARDPGLALESVVARRLTECPYDGADVTARALTGTVLELLGRGRPVADVARAVGLGERQLHRRSLDAFGYGPKTLARVLRMRRALALATGGTSLAEVAARAGYADQAHLSREVRALAGAPVTELLGARRP